MPPAEPTPLDPNASTHATAVGVAATPGGGAADVPGRYVVLHPHARGGLGEVFVATDLEFGREVALKAIQEPYADDPGSRERFVREAEITGRLEHPGVVPVHGRGHRPDGRPYYAMRFVRGDTLDAAVKAFHAAGGRFDGVPFRQLLARFVSVCQTVGYAHSRGVVHRDLKPANVMLGPFGEVLVIDWGLARATAGPEVPPAATATATSGSEVTEQGHAVGTPAYMSPEQAAGRWDAVGPVSDIYALGGILYCLLTNQAPVATGTALERLAKAECGDVPAARAVNPKVPPPLAAVAHRALSRDAAARYPTAAALAADCERWLADEPVTAFRESLLARGRRRLRKHSRLVAAALAVLAAGSATFAGAAVWVNAARRGEAEARRGAEQQRDVAERQRRQTRDALEAMTSDVAREWLAAQKELLPAQRKFLRDVIAYYDAMAADAPADEAGRLELAWAHLRVAKLRSALGQTAAAEGDLRAALAAFEHLVAAAPATVEYREGLAIAINDLADDLADTNREAAAEPLYRRALAERERLLAAAPTEPKRQAALAGAHNNFGVLLADQRRPAEAIPHYEAARGLYEALLVAEPGAVRHRVQLASVFNNLANLHKQADRFPQAAAAYRAAEQLGDQLAREAPDDLRYRSDLAMTRTNLASLLTTTGATAEAEAMFRGACAVLTKLAADQPGRPRYRERLASVRSNYADLLLPTGRVAEAAAELQAAISLRSKLVADEPAVGEYRLGLARLYRRQTAALRLLGRPADAEAAAYAGLSHLDQLQREAATSIPTLLARGQSLEELALTLAPRDEAAALGRFAEAIAVVEPVARDRPSPNATDVLRSLYWERAILHDRADRPAQARADYERALATSEGRSRTILQFDVLRCRARLGDTAAATDAAATDAAALEPTLTAGNDLCHCGAVFALCAAASSGAEADGYATRAMGLLHRGIAAGATSVGERLLSPQFAALRGRADYWELVWAVAGG